MGVTKPPLFFGYMLFRRYIIQSNVLRTEVRGDFNIHGTNFFYNAVVYQKSNKYDVVSLPVPLVGQKTCPPHEILTWLFIIENAL